MTKKELEDRRAVTWDLPVEVIDAAKAAAAAEGMLLWRWVARALKSEINRGSGPGTLADLKRQ